MTPRTNRARVHRRVRNGGACMKYGKRSGICGALVASGLALQVALEAACRIERPRLLRPLSSLPMEIGEWVGADRPVKADLVERAQTTDYLSRTYESRKW